MKIADLITEAPLGSYDVVGDLDDRGSFRSPDRAIIASAKTPNRLRHAFRNTQEIFDLVFLPVRGQVSDIAAAGEQYGGVWTRKVAQKRLPGRMLPKPSSPDAIMVVLTHNEGANRLPLSPWIIAHRIGHAIAFDPMGAEALNNMLYRLDDLTQSISDGCADQNGDNVSKLNVAYTIGTMRSARERRLNGYAEFLFELLTQYLMAGKITFNRFTDPLTIASSGVCMNYPTDEANLLVSGVEDSLNDRCAQLLASLRGKVVVL